MVVGVRDGVDEDSNKRNQADFVLWFTKSKFNDQELKWNSPWGVGYPGWHIECSGISIKNLGEYLDIHCGGVDNIFPHHTNEIAQSESYKMSKSKGNILTVSTLIEKGYNPLSYRYLCLTSHYRKQLMFSYDILDNAEKSYLKLKNKVQMLNTDGDVDKEVFNKYNEQFKDLIAMF